MRAVEATSLTKIYRLYHSPYDRFREVISPTRKIHHREFYALHDISLSVGRGETVGIVGQNGSGKSTLLKILSGVIRPTRGRVHVYGRLSSLLELGAGFNSDFTGRDNVYMNGALMGFSRKEMDSRFAEIEEFADIGEYLDQPIKTYSSGMYMRLAFSAAINVDPDILIVDEILAVGDETFQTKCRGKIQDLRRRGKTVLLVSHDTFTVENICSRVYLLDQGRCVQEGSPEQVLPVYKNILRTKSLPKRDGSGSLDVESGVVSSAGDFKRWGTREVEITGAHFIDGEGKRVTELKLETNGELTVLIEFVAAKRVDRPVFGVALHRSDGLDVARTNTRLSGLEIPSILGKGSIKYTVARMPLMPGRFTFTVSVSDYDVFVAYDVWYKCLSFAVSDSPSVKGRAGVVNLDSRWSLCGE